MQSQTSQRRIADPLAEAEALLAGGRTAEAESKFEQLSVEGPHAPGARLRLGEISFKKGQLLASIERFRSALALRPDWAEAHCKLGKALLACQKPDEAAASLSKAVTIDPQAQDARTALAAFYKSIGFWRNAAQHLAELIPQRANDASVFQQFGLCCQELGDFVLAEKALEKAGQLGLDSPQLFFNLGIVRLRLQQANAAIDCFQQALTRNPVLPLANLALGKTYRQIGDLDAAEATLRRELVVNRTCADAMLHLGLVLQAKRRIADAIQCYKQAINLNPFPPIPRQNYAIVSLLATDHRARWNNDARGWQTRYEPMPTLEKPQWDGNDLGGRTILLRGADELIDTLALIRFLPQVAALNGRVILQCHSILKRLVASTPSVVDVIESESSFLPNFDVHATLEELPQTIGSVPDNSELEWEPHIKIEAGSGVAADESKSFRVGLAWSETPRNSILSDIPLDLAFWNPVLEVGGCEFFCLQSRNVPKPDSRSHIKSRIHGFPIRFPDFADLAEVICHLDLVISVDSPIAHLAGAMGHSVWVILPYSADWRWLLRRGERPWYPTISVFREPSPGEQAATMREIARNLFDLVSRITK